MKKAIIMAIVCVLLVPAAAQSSQIETERQIKAVEPSFIQQEDTIYNNCWFEYSWIKQGSRKINWRTLTNRFAYLYNNRQAPYIEITRHERAGVEDYTGVIGAVLKGQDDYGSIEAGFGGPQADFIYKFESAAEYARRIKGGLYGKGGLRYLRYSENDVYIVSPGLINYFGDNYVSADYNLSFTESRDCAHWVTFKGAIKAHKRVNLWFGSAIGQRLYDINLLKAKKQYSYIFFNGVDFSVTKSVDLRLGYSYSMEKPKFIKRSIECSISFKF